MCFDRLKPDASTRWRDYEGRTVTVHGFRSSFKGWSVAAGMPDHLSEMALAHAERKKTRRAMMEKWAEAAARGPASPVILAEHCAAHMAASA